MDLHLQLAVTIESFYKETILFFMNSDTLYANLI